MEINDFDWEIYRELNFDLRKKLTTPKEYYEHFMMFGKKENRHWNIYQLYPNFQWEVYKYNYDDIKNLSKERLEKHWLQIGSKENRISDRVIQKRGKVYDVFNELGIQHIYISPDLGHLARVKNFYKLIDYERDNHNYNKLLIFGLYNRTDFHYLQSHNGHVYLMWGGSDETTLTDEYINIIKNKEFLIHIAISENIYKRLLNRGFKKIIKVPLDLTNYDIFRDIEKKGPNIFIYDGLYKRNQNIYGKEVFEEIMKRLHYYDFILSSDLGRIKNEEMFEIYKKCFIGLRLTANDGNANMVHELKAMTIPVVHNWSDYGLKWESVQDVINHIEEYSKPEYIQRPVKKISVLVNVQTLDEFIIYINLFEKQKEEHKEIILCIHEIYKIEQYKSLINNIKFDFTLFEYDGESYYNTLRKMIELCKYKLVTIFQKNVFYPSYYLTELIDDFYTRDIEYYVNSSQIIHIYGSDIIFKIGNEYESKHIDYIPNLGITFIKSSNLLELLEDINFEEDFFDDVFNQKLKEKTQLYKPSVYSGKCKTVKIMYPDEIVLKKYMWNEKIHRVFDGELERELVMNFYNLDYIKDITSSTDRYIMDDSIYFYCGNDIHQLNYYKHLQVVPNNYNIHTKFYQILPLTDIVNIDSNLYRVYEIKNKTPDIETRLYIDGLLNLVKKPNYSVIRISSEPEYTFSVIFSFFLGEEQLSTLCESLFSIVSQTFKNFEIILINDFSDIDDSLITKLCDTLKNVTYIKNNWNYGSSTSKNIGLKLSKGNLITFCDSGDSYNSTRLDNINKIFQNQNVYVYNQIIIDKNKSKPLYNSLVFRQKNLYNYGFLRDIRYGCMEEYFCRIVNLYSKNKFIKDTLENSSISNFYLDKNILYYQKKTSPKIFPNILEHEMDYRMNYFYYYTKIIENTRRIKNHLSIIPKYIRNKIQIGIVDIIVPIINYKFISYVIKKFDRLTYPNKKLTLCLSDSNLKKYIEPNTFSRQEIQVLEFPNHFQYENMLHYAINNTEGEFIFILPENYYISESYIENYLYLVSYEHKRVYSHIQFYVYNLHYSQFDECVSKMKISIPNYELCLLFCRSSFYKFFKFIETQDMYRLSSYYFNNVFLCPLELTNNLVRLEIMDELKNTHWMKKKVKNSIIQEEFMKKMENEINYII